MRPLHVHPQKTNNISTCLSRNRFKFSPEIFFTTNDNNDPITNGIETRDYFTVSIESYENYCRILQKVTK